MSRDFRARGDTSMVQLLQESGYKECREQITEDHIRQYVDTHHENINSWQRYSADQRSSPSWYFCGKTIGYVSRSGTKESEKEYPSEVEACAAYIKNMMEQLIG